MKKMNKFAAVLMAIAMMFSLASVAMAEGGAGNDGTITIDHNHAGHIYQAWQIFTGDLTSATSDKLTNIQWGANISDDGKIALSTKYLTVPSTVTGDTGIANWRKASERANEIAQILSTYDSDSAQAKEFARLVGTLNDAGDGFKYLKDTPVSVGKQGEAPMIYYKATGVAYGYYVVTDKPGTQTNESSSYSAYQLMVVGTGVSNGKVGSPVMEKKVYDLDDSTGLSDSTGHSAYWGDTADHDVGDNVGFRLSATMPSNLNQYDTYKLVFHDSMSQGLTLNSDSFEVWVGERGTIGAKQVDISCFDVDTTDTYKVDASDSTHVVYTDGSAFSLTIDDAKALKEQGKTTDPALSVTASSSIYVYYTAKLNSDAVVGLVDGNPNKAYLQYSNNPNLTENPTLGKTPEDEVVVYTYNIVINKTDGTNPLAGADFDLEKFYADDHFTFVSYDETTKVVQFNFTNGDSTELVSGTLQLLPGETTYEHATVSLGSGLNFDYYVNHTMANRGFVGHWAKVTSKDTVTAETTTFKWNKVDDGFYRLSETKTPAGHNTIDGKLYFHVKSTHGQAGASVIATYGGDRTNISYLSGTNHTMTLVAGAADNFANLTGTVVNGAGQTLPSTGGIGTTIFYVVGGILAVGAAILLITKKRMDIEK